tara:strand:- start:5379 stop:5813 length:435 start_codon:yes stop_codon:yes gene_type:complete
MSQQYKIITEILMKIKMLTVAVMASVLIALLACSDDSNKTSEAKLTLDQVTLTAKPTTKRWYFTEQAERGKVIFSGRCSVCHGNNAEAIPDWKTPNKSSNYPPPLNGNQRGRVIDFVELSVIECLLLATTDYSIALFSHYKLVR